MHVVIDEGSDHGNREPAKFWLALLGSLWHPFILHASIIGEKQDCAA